ncbi:Uncharacterised protein (plasmid) [Tsukamurella tyrosinosolvens]|uniref:Uncharacterized protein n=1 Tax=Tsukamurella tyrosinosolvens TaxID=57704 RepID=A0A1H4V0Z2_TSUTY|nr:hypothetical protein [Tsukamurella tyrosinosolvens]KXO91082.1 hypothetical protein AXK58_21875 [Tsukamurella tyrosinosolvens]SEC74636.1 hypothetical protein SAMN04489793_3104 [Tsukamurella tyrosinosolvens]VEH90753.1 Uncharacterised protein [Tsukamurella tyrosinosolvens]
MPDLATLPVDALTVMPDGRVYARNMRALSSLPDGAVIRDAEPLVGELVTEGRRRAILWTGESGANSLADVVFDPTLGVEVLAGPPRAARG